MADIHTGEIILYNTDDGQLHVDLHAIDGTVWLNQSEIATLFDKSRTTINEHIKNIFQDNELSPQVVCRTFRHTTQHGAIQGKTQTQETMYYSLEMILAIGFRVRSPRAVQFRQWTNTILQEYLVKGFAMNDDRLKQSEQWDYFDEWLARIRDIRASEKRFYQKVRDLYATAIDYDPKSQISIDFFAKVQNKMLWAITGKTAPEILNERSDSNKPNMGLQSWKGSIVRKGDVTIAKNYLGKAEIEELNLIVTMYLDYAELQATNRKTVTMQQWSDKLDSFLSFNEKDVLQHAGSIKAEIAQQTAQERYHTYDKNRKQQQSIDADNNDIQEIEKLLNKHNK